MAELNYIMLSLCLFCPNCVPALCEKVLTEDQLRTRGGVSVATKQQLFDSSTLDIPLALKDMLMTSPDRHANRDEATVCSGSFDTHIVCPDNLGLNTYFKSYKQLTVEGSTFKIYCCHDPGWQKCCSLEEYKIWNGKQQLPGWMIAVIVVSVIVSLLICIGIPIALCCLCGCGLAMCAKSSQTTGSTITGGYGGTTAGYGGTTAGYGGTTAGYGGTTGGYGGTAGGTTGGYGGTAGGTTGGYGGTGATPAYKA